MKRDRVICILAFAAAATVLAPRTYSQEKKEAGDTHKIVHFGDLKWTPIIKGCDLASVAGDSNAEGAPFVVRIRCTDGSKIPAHWHPTDENVTVLKGTFLVGMGETFDDSKMLTMNALQGELGESVRSAAAGRRASSRGKTKILRTVREHINALC